MADPRRNSRRSWQRRKYLNVSAHAQLCVFKIVKLLHEMKLDITPSPSTAVEFMFDVVMAYHDKRRLNISEWRPRTRTVRRKLTGEAIQRQPKYILDAMFGGEEFLEKKISNLEKEIEDARTARSENAKRARRIGDARRAEAAAEKNAKQR